MTTTLHISPDVIRAELPPLPASISVGRRTFTRTDAAEALQRLHAGSLIDTATGCWIWTGNTKNGYPVLSIHDGPVYGHRLVATLLHGSALGDLHACHHCDVRRCWRPSHLFAGTQADNNADMRRKGRWHPPPRITGEANHKATLTDADVAAIRDTYRRGGVTQHALADRYNVSQSTIWRLVHEQVRA